MAYAEAMPILRRRFALITFVCCPFHWSVLHPVDRSADITAFLGSNPTPVDAAGQGFRRRHGACSIAGFEFEYANTNDDLVKAAPQPADVHVQRAAADAGPNRRLAVLRDGRRGGLSRDARTCVSETNVGINVGGGREDVAGGAAALAASITGSSRCAARRSIRSRSASMRESI